MGTSPGRWIFSRDILQWMADPTLRGQLPMLYQLLARYSQTYFRWTAASQLPYGVSLFKAIARASQVLAPQEYLHLQLEPYEVYLNPVDPRWLQVVNELTSPQEDPQCLRRFLAPGDSFVDVGANHGSFSLVATGLVGKNGAIVAVEPQPVLARAVELSLQANAQCPVQVYPVAVGNQTGDIELMIPQDSSGSAGIFHGHSGVATHATVTVPLRRFDDLVDWRSLPGQVVVKLDVEGNELAFLQGAQAFLAARQPTLLMEINPGTLAVAGTTGEALKGLLTDLGYRHYQELRTPDLSEPLALSALPTDFHRNIVVIPQGVALSHGSQTR